MGPNASRFILDLCSSIASGEASIHEIQQWWNDHESNHALLKQATNFKDEYNCTPLHYLL
jgi:hypothetical protein